MKKHCLLNNKTLPKKTLVFLGGLIFCLLILEISLRVGGFIFLYLQDYRNKISIREKQTYRILCLGESSTFLQWPHRLEEILNKKNTGLKFSVIDKAIPAANSIAIMSQLEDNLNKYNPQMVIAMMGINDGTGTKTYQPESHSKGVIKFLKNFKIYDWVKLVRVYIKEKSEEEKFSDSETPKTKPINPPGDKLIEKEKSEEEKFSDLEPQRIKPINPPGDKLIELGESLRIHGQYDKAIEVFQEALRLNPENEQIHYSLGLCYYNQGQYDTASRMFKKGISINPQSEKANSTLGLMYLYQGEYKKAIEPFKAIIKMNPDSVTAYTYISLGQCYYNLEKYAAAEEVFKEALKLTPENDEIYIRLALCYNARGREKLAREYFQKANKMRLEKYNPTTRYHYQKLQRILSRRGIKLVCAQYPMRNVKFLETMFLNKDDILFVENETVFRKAVENAGYKEYFLDRYAGDFGHCTEKGNLLLAENIADVLLTKYFKVSK